MEELINKYLLGTASEKQMLELEQWVNESDENRRIFSKAVNIAAVSSRRNPEMGNNIEDLHKIIVDLRKKELKRRFRRMFATITVAASIVLFISLYANYRIAKYKTDVDYILAQSNVTLEYSTPYGTKSKVLLPDSSIVWLNSGSNISFPSKFSGNSREVYFSGEGFFEIAKDSTHPMNVITPQGLNVIVLGTQFNLSAYTDNKDISIMLVSGKVEIETKQGNKKFSIMPKERCIVDNNSAKYVINIPQDTLPILGWKAGWLVFDDVPLEQVFKNMRRVYGVEFIFKDKTIFNQKLSAKFKDESLTQVLDLMHRVSLINYFIKDSSVYISKFE